MRILLSLLPAIVAIVMAFSAMSKADALAKRVARLEGALRGSPANGDAPSDGAPTA